MRYSTPRKCHTNIQWSQRMWLWNIYDFWIKFESTFNRHSSSFNSNICNACTKNVGLLLFDNATKAIIEILIPYIWSKSTISNLHNKHYNSLKPCLRSMPLLFASVLALDVRPIPLITAITAITCNAIQGLQGHKCLAHDCTPLIAARQACVKRSSVKLMLAPGANMKFWVGSAACKPSIEISLQEQLHAAWAGNT